MFKIKFKFKFKFKLRFKLKFKFKFMFRGFIFYWGHLYLPSTSIGVSSEMGTLEMKASSLFSMVSMPPPEVFNFKAKVVAEFSKEIFLPPSCSLFNRF